MAEIQWGLAQTPNYFQAAMQAQQAGEQRRAEIAKQNALQMYAQDPVNGLQALAAADPATYIQIQNVQAQQARQASQDARQARLDGQPKFIEGPDGIYAVDPATGENKRVADYPVKPPAAPAGYTWDGEGNNALRHIPGGPGDPVVYGQRATVNRQAVVKNPMPRAAGGGGAGLGSMSNEQLIALARSLK